MQKVAPLTGLTNLYKDAKIRVFIQNKEGAIMNNNRDSLIALLTQTQRVSVSIGGEIIIDIRWQDMDSFSYSGYGLRRQ